MQQDNLIIILADISGYTRFMVENRTSAVHGQICINSLIEAILEQVDIPLTLQEIEGDAVFLYARNPGDETLWQNLAQEISSKLLKFFDAFISATGVNIESTPCGCAICRNADKLGLKIVVHAGEAVFHELAGRPQVSGPDVILAHRLLKNSVPGNKYLLLSDPAFELMGQHLKGDFEAFIETYEGFDPLTVRVRFLEEDFLAARDAIYSRTEAERADLIDNYFSWVERMLQPAAVAQMRKPIRSFSLFERMLMVWDSVAGLWQFRRTFRSKILAEQNVRGMRRTQFAQPLDLRPNEERISS
ncbi:MAG: DUF2652 domain-containing protein [Proteobacteria bacterium]|nr:DUF2652 domain-containing protein [Pseudomonadota bacterium]